MDKGNKRVEVLLEEIRSDVKLALEGHDVIRHEMRQMEERLTEKIEENSSAIKFVAGRVTQIDRKLDEQLRQHAGL